jgi:hypothetical protein
MKDWVNLLANDWDYEKMNAVLIIKFISNALKIIAMGFFMFSAYKGVFNGGNSTTVFIGVAALTVVIVITHIIDDIKR